MLALGIDQLQGPYHHLIANRRIALISTYSMTNSQWVPVIEQLAKDPGTHLVRLFGPEHGVLGAAREGAPVPFATDAHTGLPAVSLYGLIKAPPPETLQDLDGLVIDLQDIGARYYTNLSTLYYAMEAAELAHIPLIVLDRPNPIGGLQREGGLLHPDYQSFVGMLPIPVRHGLTFGEIAQWIRRHAFSRAEVIVVPMAGWFRDMFWPDTSLPFVSTSPNTTNFDMTLLYPGTCLFEGTNVSLGRGTPHPFEWIGAPWINGHHLASWFNAQKLPGVVARPLYFTPWQSPYSGELVQGVQLHITRPRALHSLKTGVTLLQGFQTLYPEAFRFTSPDDSSRRPFFDLLAGGPQLRETLQSNTIDQYFSAEHADITQFNQAIIPDLIYPDYKEENDANR